MSLLDTARAVVSHRGESALDLKRHIGEQDAELRWLRDRADTATRLEARNDEQAQTIHSLRAQLERALAIKDDTNARAVRCSEAEARAVRSERHMREFDAELMELRAFKANTLSVDQPAGQRDIDPDGQPTQPIAVLTLPQAFGHVVATPGTANPASIPQQRSTR